MRLPSATLLVLYTLASTLSASLILASPVPQPPLAGPNTGNPAVSPTNATSPTPFSIERADLGRYFFTSTTSSIRCRSHPLVFTGAVYPLTLDALPLSAVKPYWDSLIATAKEEVKQLEPLLHLAEGWGENRFLWQVEGLEEGEEVVIRAVDAKGQVALSAPGQVRRPVVPEYWAEGLDTVDAQWCYNAIRTPEQEQQQRDEDNGQFTFWFFSSIGLVVLLVGGYIWWDTYKFNREWERRWGRA